jgi:hypothetical protein
MRCFVDPEAGLLDNDSEEATGSGISDAGEALS